MKFIFLLLSVIYTYDLALFKPYSIDENKKVISKIVSRKIFVDLDVSSLLGLIDEKIEYHVELNKGNIDSIKVGHSLPKEATNITASVNSNEIKVINSKLDKDDIIITIDPSSIKNLTKASVNVEYSYNLNDMHFSNSEEHILKNLEKLDTHISNTNFEISLKNFNTDIKIGNNTINSNNTNTSTIEELSVNNKSKRISFRINKRKNSGIMSFIQTNLKKKHVHENILPYESPNYLPSTKIIQKVIVGAYILLMVLLFLYFYWIKK